MSLICYRTILKVLFFRQNKLPQSILGNCHKYFHSKNVHFKDAVQSPQPTGGQDLLLQNIKLAENEFNLLEMIASYHAVMNKTHVMQALRSLFEFEKLEGSRISKKSLVENPEFFKLCKRLKSQARMLELSDTIDALKIVLFFGVPSDSSTVDILLQLIRHRVNDLNLSQILFVDFLLDKCSQNPLSSALKIALPIVFNIHLKTKLDSSFDCNQLVNILQYVVKYDTPSSSVDFLIKSLQKSMSTLDTANAQNIVWSLTRLPSLSNSAQELFSEALQTVASDIDSIPYKETENLLSKLVAGYSKTCSYYYNKDYFSACARYIVHNDCGLVLGSRCLRKLSQIGHVDIELLEYLGEKVVKNPEAFLNSGPSVLFSLVTGLSKANYLPLNWNSIRNIILQHRLLFKQNNVALPWIKFAVELTSLDCFPSQLIEYIFGESFLKVFLNRENNFLDHIQLLFLYQTVVTLMPDYLGPWPPDDIIQKAALMNGTNINDFPLLTALEHGLGGNSYVCTKVYTKLGHFIDHAVVIRKGGFPVALNLDPAITSRIFIEDLDVAKDCKIILILCMHQSCYAVNCNRLKGLYSLMERSLKAMDYGVILISVMDWNQLPSHEKIPYIMRAINSTYEAECVANLDSFQ